MMKKKLDTSESEKDGTVQIEESSTNSLQNRLDFTERKTRKKLPHIFNHASTDYGKISSFSSNSKIQSYLRGNSLAENEAFKQSDSAIINQISEKYVPRGTQREKVKQEMQLVLQRKTSEIEALRVHRDQLKFISYNNPYDIPIKISLAVLKQKAKTEEKVKDYKNLLQKDIRELESQFNTMTDYYNFVTNCLKAKGEEDLIIDTQQEEKLMIQNLQKENNHLFRELKQEDKRNAKQIKGMQEEIATLRVYIKQKEDKIRDLKSKICFLHIKLHSRSSNSKEKTMSMSIRKFNAEQNSTVQEAFIGNNSFKNFSKEIIEKVENNQSIHKIRFYYETKRQLLTFRCIYRQTEGKLHDYREDAYKDNQFKEQPKGKKQAYTDIRVKYLLSFKFYFKSRIVGVECRLKSEKGSQTVQIGNCSAGLEHQLLTLINKNIVTLGSYWHQKDMIGVGVWFCLRGAERNPNVEASPTQKRDILRTVRSAKQLNQDYYS